MRGSCRPIADRPDKVVLGGLGGGGELAGVGLYERGEEAEGGLASWDCDRSRSYMNHAKSVPNRNRIGKSFPFLGSGKSLLFFRIMNCGRPRQSFCFF